MAPFPLNSYTTALVILAPPHLHPAINAIRATNDKSYPRWQPHLTLIFPFAAPEHLPLAISRLRESLAEAKAEAFRLRLDSVARFQQRNYDTVYLGPSHDAEIRKVWNVAAGTMGYTGRDFVPHLTLGQSPTQQQSLDFLGRKAEKLKDSGTLEWVVDRLVVLKKSELDGGAMAVYEEILLAPSTSVTSSPTPPRPIEQPYPTFHFTGNQWTVFAPPAPPTVNSTLSVATFNILDSSFHPQHNRFHPLKRAILSANADIICLQEVTSSFLPLLLNDEEIQRAYGFCNRNGDKMENERNIVVFSRFGFGWEAVGLGTKHKEAHILTFQRPLSSSPDSELIVAAVHLSAGLSAALIERKLAELDNLVSELTKNHPRSPWIVTGDFNLPSTISTSPPLPAVLSDVWNLLRSEDSATYDPSSNPLAAEVVASIPHATIEPQRFDRMFIKSDMGDLNVVDVKLFGFPDKGEVGSDHWGLVSRFAFEGPGYSESGDKQNALEVIPTQLTSDDLLSTLLAQNFLPTPTTSQSHESAFTTISSLLSSTSPPLHVVKVGSTAIGVETEGSDIDCLCISNFNANTFWEVVKGRIRGDNNEGGAVKLRKFVKEAAVKMMELDVGGIKIDLQYCCAPKLVDM
jgi:2'-5' RNA ligase/endonuclease/exonuclease/phosphatase family metal-dependent hydrolase